MTFMTYSTNQVLFIVWRRHSFSTPPSPLSSQGINFRLNFAVAQDSTTSYVPYCSARSFAMYGDKGSLAAVRRGSALSPRSVCLESGDSSTPVNDRPVQR